ncbi:hypothetical protein [Streptomyces eurythermus]
MQPMAPPSGIRSGRRPAPSVASLRRDTSATPGSPGPLPHPDHRDRGARSARQGTGPGPRPRGHRPRPRPPGPPPGEDSRPRRIQVSAGLAADPHTPHAAVTDALHILHSAENVEGPDWSLTASAAVPAADGEDEGALPLLADDDLDRRTDPAAVLRSWPDSPAAGESFGTSPGSP